MTTLAELRNSKPCRHLAAAGICLMLAAGCSALKPVASPASPDFYSLDRPGAVVPSAASMRRVPPLAAPSLVVGLPAAAAGFDSQRIIYTRQAHKLESFAHSEWIDPPARMLAPMIVAAIEASGAFRAVVRAPSPAAGDLRLDTEILLLQHEFGNQPSRVRFALRVYLVEEATRRIVASRDFESVSMALSDDPYGGVVAANAAVAGVLENLATFCAEAAANWRPASAASR